MVVPFILDSFSPNIYILHNRLFHEHHEIDIDAIYRVYSNFTMIYSLICCVFCSDVKYLSHMQLCVNTITTKIQNCPITTEQVELQSFTVWIVVTFMLMVKFMHATGSRGLIRFHFDPFGKAYSGSVLFFFFNVYFRGIQREASI